MEILVVDNFDSFTYNLVYLLKRESLIKKVTVVRNNQVTLEDAFKADKILIGPGPGIPSEAGSMCDIIKSCAPEKSILGICLGHQGIGEIFGCELENMNRVKHGIQEDIYISGNDYLFAGLKARFTGGLYHSWRIRKSTIRKPLEIIALDNAGEVMAIKHNTYDLRGIQFHPESILTGTGQQIINNWINNKYKS